MCDKETSRTMTRRSSLTPELRRIRPKWQNQKDHAKERGIEFRLTFTEWWDIWQQSGKWDLYGKKKGQYCMSRYGDLGAYEVGNVFIQLASDNIRQANTKE